MLAAPGSMRQTQLCRRWVAILLGETHQPRSAGYMAKPQQAIPRTSTGSLQERLRALVLECSRAVGGSVIHEGETTGREHAEFTMKTKPHCNLPPVKTCCLAVKPSAIIERMQETKAGFPHLACLMSTLHSLEHRERPLARASPSVHSRVYMQS